jgi:hypothetical protein
VADVSQAKKQILPEHSAPEACGLLYRPAKRWAQCAEAMTVALVID